VVLKIFETIATSGFLTAFECTKFATDPIGVGLTALPRPSSWFKGPYLLEGVEGEGEEKRREGERKGRGWTAPPP